MKSYYLGIDTSCYTTSCAIVDESGNLLGEARKILEVADGKRGLQQSNMVFQHTRVLPSLIESLPQVPLAAIGVSAFPRREEDSYMPAFLVGKGHGHSLAHMMKIPVYEFSHQENHILAALRKQDYPLDKPFFSLHLSGGTTELVYCQPCERGIIDTRLLGGAMDLHGGQFVDRIGVALGLHFPTGAQLDSLSQEGEDYEPLPSAVKAGQISFGGPCSEALRRIERAAIHEMNTEDLVNYQGQMGRAVFHAMANSLEKMLAYHLEFYPVEDLVAVGGVMSNGYIRQRLQAFCKRHKITAIFADPKYSVDNATGVAFGASLMATKSYT